ncbi:hypothetical protein B0H19DRAFT_1123097 [Mycena capillaripes]|nr:hypothetical protein B0H19DRAFT_1123097 [Mycena capillaripes]
MTTIPQELVEVILADFHPVDDRESLKYISLTATNFAGPAQRIMFRSLALHAADIPGWYPTFERALNLFNGSPHIALYVEDLTVRLPIQGSPKHHNLLEQVLPMFSNVRRFVLRGVGVTWDNLELGLKTTLATFLLRASLEKLHLSQILDMPLAIIAIAAQTISVLSLQNIFVKAEPETQWEEGLNPSSSPRLTHLILASPPGGEFDPFQKLILPAYIANIQRLVIQKSAFSNRLIHAVASTLTDLSFDCFGTQNPFDLPQLPKLASLELKLGTAFRVLLPGWLPATLVQLPVALPALRTLTLHLELLGHRSPVQGAPQTDLAVLDAPGTVSGLSALDNALCGTVPRLVWNLAFTELSRAHSELVVACVRAAVERNMVRMHEASATEVAYTERQVYEESLP